MIGRILDFQVHIELRIAVAVAVVVVDSVLGRTAVGVGRLENRQVPLCKLNTIPIT